MTEEKKGEGFVVRDKRFSESSEEPKEEPKAASASEVKPTQPEAGLAGETMRQGNALDDEGEDYPSVSFSNFVISLSTSALFHFGDFPEVEGGQAAKNLPAAKQTIDILDMLNEKTKGNLDQNESNLIQGVLYELKMRYVKEKG